MILVQLSGSAFALRWLASVRGYKINMLSSLYPQSLLSQGSGRAAQIGEGDHQALGSDSPKLKS